MKKEEYICPLCLSKMNITRKPYNAQDFLLGFYEAVECPLCDSYFFTDKGFNDIRSDYDLFDVSKVISEPLITIMESRSDNKKTAIYDVVKDTIEIIISTINSSRDTSVSENTLRIAKSKGVKSVQNAA